jgi:hypothetical protein
MSFARSIFLLCSFAAVLLRSPPLLGQSQAEQDSAKRQPSSTAAATIVLVGALGEDGALADVLLEFLRRRQVEVRFVRQPQFHNDELLAARQDDAVQVFVVPSSDGARLYFRGPTGERFLLRKVELPRGLDELGRELLGQIVESSVDALLHTEAGITREEAQTELDKQAPQPPRVSVSQTRPGKAIEAASSPAKAEPSAWEGWLALRYAAELTGDPGLGHGPGLEFGLGMRRTFLVRARVIGERWFPQSIQGAAIGADLLTARARLVLDLGFELDARAALLVSIGGGMDRLRIEPAYAREHAVELAEPSLKWLPAAHAELRLEVGGSSLRLALATSLETSLRDTHYDIVVDGNAVRIAEEWPVRPGASIALAWRPRL